MMEGWRETVMAVLAAVVPGWGDDAGAVYNGYVEADFVYVAAAAPGRMVEIATDEGEVVTQGQLLFRLDDLEQTAAMRAAEARVAEAEFTLDNLLTGSREEEIAVLRASIDRALAEQALAEKTLERSQTLLSRNFVPEAQVDADEAALKEMDAQVAEMRAQLRVAELPARDAEVQAARSAVDAAKAEADRAQSDLEDRVVTAPVAGVVGRVYFDEGEITATGTPVVSILPPVRRTVLFFIPEPERAGFAIGNVLALSCDGCPAGLEATLSRLASDPQFTPPIIYSREERQRLVFRAEAKVADGVGLLPGQPVTLRRP
jgi:HlyD family secretion protein